MGPHSNHKSLRVLALLAGLSSALWPSFIGAQQDEVGLKMDVDKREVEVGDTATLTIEFRQATGANNTLQGEPQISALEHFDIRGSSTEVQVTQVGNATLAISRTKLTLVATKPGQETIGPAYTTYTDSQGKKHDINSNVVTVTVSEKSGFSLFKKKKPAPGNPAPPPAAGAPPTPVGDDQLRDIKPLLAGTSLFLLGLAAVILLLLGGFIWWQLAKPAAAGPPPLPGKAAQLREAWKKLGKDDLEAKAFCLALSSLVRECLQYRFGFPAVDFTTGEILEELKKQKPTEEEAAAAEKCLRTCDRVLYADGNLTGREGLRTMVAALLPKKDG